MIEDEGTDCDGSPLHNKVASSMVEIMPALPSMDCTYLQYKLNEFLRNKCITSLPKVLKRPRLPAKCKDNISMKGSPSASHCYYLCNESSLSLQ
jgi:hypothetical protein